jgi:hypothetical protein
MTYLITTQSTGGDHESFRAVCDVLDAERPDGLLARYAGINDVGLVVTGIWTSKAHADRFTSEQLLPALQQVIGCRATGLPPTTIDTEVIDDLVIETTR